MRAAIIKFYLANSGFNKEILTEVIGEALFQLEMLGYPSITKRIETLVSGLSRDQKGNKSHDNGRSEDNAEEVWGTSILEIRKTADAQRNINSQYKKALEGAAYDLDRSGHHIVFRPCDACHKDSRQKIQIKTKKQIYAAQREWVKRKLKEGILK